MKTHGSFINDMVDTCGGTVKAYLFADNAKMYCHIKDVEDEVNLQTGVDNFVDWTDIWQVKVNVNKCKVISVHRRRYADKGVILNYVMNNIKLEEVDEINNLGVHYEKLLLFDKHRGLSVKKEIGLSLIRCWI